MTTNSEKVDMVLVYDECHRNSRKAGILYAERYHPPNNYFFRIESGLRNSDELPARCGNNILRKNQRIEEANK